MLVRTLYALGVFILVALASYILGLILQGLEPLASVGTFLAGYCVLIGALAGVWYFLVGLPRS